MALRLRAAALAGVLVGTTILAAPAAASPLDISERLGAPSAAFDASRYDPAAQNAEWRCRWGRCGWGGGWGGGWGRRGWRRNRIDAGDVLIGAAIIGGVLAITESNRRRNRDRDVVIVERDRDLRDRDWNREPDPRFRDDDRRTADRSFGRGSGASGLDNAVTMCLDRIERDVRVDTVDNVERTGAGWRVSGALFDGSPFQCRIGNNGQIDGIDYDGGLRGGAASPGTMGISDSALPRGEGQWSDDRYIAARAGLGGTVRPDMAVNDVRGFTPSAASVPAPAVALQGAAMPAYPGGPIPGEVIPETLEEANGG